MKQIAAFLITIFLILTAIMIFAVVSAKASNCYSSCIPTGNGGQYCQTHCDP